MDDKLLDPYIIKLNFVLAIQIFNEGCDKMHFLLSIVLLL